MLRCDKYADGLFKVKEEVPLSLNFIRYLVTWALALWLAIKKNATVNKPVIRFIESYQL